MSKNDKALRISPRASKNIKFFKGYGIIRFSTFTFSLLEELLTEIKIIIQK